MKILPNFNPINGILVQLGFSKLPAVESNIAHGLEKVLVEHSTLGQSFAEKTGIIYSSDIGLIFGIWSNRVCYSMYSYSNNN